MRLDPPLNYLTLIVFKNYQNSLQLPKQRLLWSIYYPPDISPKPLSENQCTLKTKLFVKHSTIIFENTSARFASSVLVIVRFNTLQRTVMNEIEGE